MSRFYRFGLLGHNISYTLSPAIFKALFGITGYNGVFTVIDVDSAKLAGELDSMRTWDGFSVTVPYKQRLISDMSFVSDQVREIGAVNSVKVETGRFWGHNTDADGFIFPLREFSFAQSRILILGNGGAALAVMWILARTFPQTEINVCGRDRQKARQFIDHFQFGPGGNPKLRALAYDDITGNDRYDMIVNCTPVGGMAHPDLSPLPDDFEFEGCRVCYDLNYRPAKTLFLQRAEQAGCRIIGGLSMLVRQAVISYNIWTTSELEIEEVSKAIIKSLKEDNQGVGL